VNLSFSFGEGVSVGRSVLVGFNEGVEVSKFSGVSVGGLSASMVGVSAFADKVWVGVSDSATSGVEVAVPDSIVELGGEV
jgi:hypothetical protein